MSNYFVNLFIGRLVDFQLSKFINAVDVCLETQSASKELPHQCSPSREESYGLLSQKPEQKSV